MASGLFVRGKVRRGVFESERSFEVEIGGKVYSGIVDKGDVVCDQDPREGETVDGKIRVIAIEKQERNVLVGFTRDAINGQRAWVSEDNITCVR